MGPLAGVKILDLATVLSGPVATSMLADQGADVVKIEPPSAPDLVRQVGSRRAGITAMHLNVNRGKRSLALDLRSPAGVEVLRRLAARADVVVQNFRPGVVERLGVDYASLAEVNPGLVYCSIAGFGFHGPLAGTKVYDNMIQAASGFAAVQGGSGDPQFVRTLACDKITALHVAQAVTAALFARERGAGGQHVRIAMLDAAVSFLWPDSATAHTLLGDEVAISPAGGSSDVIRFVDGWGTAVPLLDDEFRSFCRVLGVEHVADDPRFATMALRLSDPDYPTVYRDVVLAAARTLPIAEVERRLAEAGVAAARVLALSEVAESAQAVANGTFVEDEHPVAGRVRQPAPVARFDATPSTPGRPAASTVGEHSVEILDEHGFSPEEIAELRAAGVV
jgi:crotonobetainyl-CoA:carnitine CoA-transferase CaiB-like acyl-CoA transferase